MYCLYTGGCYILFCIGECATHRLYRGGCYIRFVCTRGCATIANMKNPDGMGLGDTMENDTFSGVMGIMLFVAFMDFATIFPRHSGQIRRFLSIITVHVDLKSARVSQCPP